MRDYKIELEKRIAYIQDVLKNAHSNGVVFGNSGGKDSALVGILCKMAVDNTVGIIMPCDSIQNYASDKDDAHALEKAFNIKTEVVDLTSTKKALVDSISQVQQLNHTSLINIAPRLRMTTLYAYAAANNMVVAGTGNKCERYVGYFTKWGDGACDFNPIADLTVSEIYEFLTYLKAPDSIIKKAPSAGLFQGQTDEADMGVTYAEIEDYINGLAVSEKSSQIIERMHAVSQHKRLPISLFGE